MRSAGLVIAGARGFVNGFGKALLPETVRAPLGTDRVGCKGRVGLDFPRAAIFLRGCSSWTFAPFSDSSSIELTLRLRLALVVIVDGNVIPVGGDMARGFGSLDIFYEIESVVCRRGLNWSQLDRTRLIT